MFDKIKLGYPNLWITTPDTSRLTDIVTSTISRDFYTLDFLSGFSKYVSGTWKSVLVPNPAFQITSNDKYTVTFDAQVMLDYLMNSPERPKTPSTLIVNVLGDPNEIISQYSGILFHFKSTYRKAFWADDLAQMPLQIIFFSPQPCPEQHVHFFNILEDGIPSPQELAVIVQHINSSGHDRFAAPETVKDLVNAGLGLNESQFIDLCLSSIVSKSTLDPKYIYDNKMASIKKNGILEIIKPTISFDDIGGLDNIKDIIHRTSILWNDKSKAKEYGIAPIRRLLMVGIPGTGKSAICQATANELGLDLARTGISQVMNSFIGQSEANMRSVFKQIKLMSPLCVWIDEFGRDLSGGASSSHVDGGTTDRVHGEFLTGLQELPEDTFLLCAANSLDSLRPEMLRADRFDKIMFVGMPSFHERKHILQIHLGSIKTDHVYNYDLLAESTKYFTGAEIVSLIREVKFYVVSDNFRPITTQDILSFVPKMKNIIWLKHNDMVLSMYRYAIEQWEWASDQQLEDAHNILNKVTNTQTKTTAVAWK